MPSRKLPSTDVGRDRALTLAKSKNDNPGPAGVILSAATIARLNAIQPLFKAVLQSRGNALAAQAGSTDSNSTLEEIARTFISHFIQVFNLGVVRGVYPAADRPFYQLAVNNDRLPMLRTEQELTQWSVNIATGDAARVTAGGAIMLNPTPAQVATAAGNFTTSNVAQSGLKDAYDAAQEDVAALRAEADGVIKKVWDEVETFYNELEPSSKRRKAREYGVVYVSETTLTFSILVKNFTTGLPVQNVNVELVETGNIKVTAADGTATIISNISADEASLHCSRMGYHDADQIVPLVDGQFDYDVTILISEL